MEISSIGFMLSTAGSFEAPINLPLEYELGIADGYGDDIYQTLYYKAHCRKDFTWADVVSRGIWIRYFSEADTRSCTIDNESYYFSLIPNRLNSKNKTKREVDDILVEISNYECDAVLQEKRKKINQTEWWSRRWKKGKEQACVKYYRRKEKRKKQRARGSERSIKYDFTNAENLLVDDDDDARILWSI